jgi:hypothetical protein
VGPRALHVQPAYRKRRLWPWVAVAAVLLVLGILELRMHRHGSAAPRTEGIASATSGSPAGGSMHGVTGRVLGPGGESAPRVTVVLLPGGAEVVTAADGSFGFQLEDGAAVQVQAHHSDLGFASEEVRVPATALVLRLRPRAGLEVSVVSHGKPVPGAAVSVTRGAPGGEVFRADRPTDGAGALRFLGLPAGDLRVTALLEGSGVVAEATVAAREGQVVPVKLVLEP